MTTTINTVAKFRQPMKKAFHLSRPGEGDKRIKVNFWGGSKYDLRDLKFVPDLVIQADDFVGAAVPAIRKAIYANEAANRALPKELIDIDYPQIVVFWEDYEAPGLRREWWERLLDHTMTLPHNSNVVCCCTGGTGRTGTMLSILLGLHVTTLDDPVDTLRQLYKQSAVESAEQIEYIEDILDMLINSEPTYSWGGYAQQGYTSPPSPTTTMGPPANNSKFSPTNAVLKEGVKLELCPIWKTGDPVPVGQFAYYDQTSNVYRLVLKENVTYPEVKALPAPTGTSVLTEYPAYTGNRQVHEGETFLYDKISKVLRVIPKKMEQELQARNNAAAADQNPYHPGAYADGQPLFHAYPLFTIRADLKEGMTIVVDKNGSLRIVPISVAATEWKRLNSLPKGKWYAAYPHSMTSYPKWVESWVAPAGWEVKPVGSGLRLFPILRDSFLRGFEDGVSAEQTVQA